MGRDSGSLFGMRKPPGPVEFVLLTAALMALVAFAVYTILPAFPELIRAMQPGQANDIQYVITAIYAGMALGQVVCGPLSDRFGRKPVMYAGLLVFAAGCALASSASVFEMLLLGQLLQGFGLGAPRIVTVAIIRDRFVGNEMARVVSFVMIVFTLVPTVAPSLGQLILAWSDWRWIYGVLLLLGAGILGWFASRQPETLPPAARTQLSAAGLLEIFAAIRASRITVAYTLVAALSTSAFLAYVNLSQPVLEYLYELGASYPRYFAGFAVALSAASFLNGRLVLRLGMRRLSGAALLGTTTVSLVFCAWVLASGGRPPLWSLLAFLGIVLFCFGILVGNLNALALEPLGQVAGSGAAFVGALSTALSLPLAVLIGGAYAGASVAPLAFGFAGCGAAACIIFFAVPRYVISRERLVAQKAVRTMSARGNHERSDQQI